MDPSADTEAGAFEAALRELRDAVDLREAEHARRNSNRVLFSRAVSLFFVGVCFGLLVLTRAFDVEEFREHLLGKLRSDAPLVVRKVSDEFGTLNRVYYTEALHSAAALTDRLDTEVAAEGARLSKPAAALISGGGDLSTVADARLAALLLEKYGAELAHDPTRALALARALHGAEAQTGRVAPVSEISAALKSVSTEVDARDSGDLRGVPLVDAVHAHALDMVRTRLLSGQESLPTGGH